MLEFLSKLFDTEGFPPRRNCGPAWTDEHAWLHISSDIFISAAYLAIPILLLYFVSRRKDAPFIPVFWLFSAFILTCGLGHAIDATIFWHPVYRLSGVMKLLTAIASWATVIALIPILPKALQLPGLKAINEQLQSEVDGRKETEHKLQESNTKLRTFTSSVLDREDRVLELKHEVNALLEELGRPAKYLGDAE